MLLRLVVFLGIFHFINIVSGIFVILNKDFEREANPPKEIHVAFSNLAPLVIRNHNSMPKWDWFRIMFDGLRVLCGMSSTYRPKIVLTRAFFIICILVGMISYNTSNSFILLFMMSPIYEKQVNTVNQIIEQKFDLTGDSLTLQMLSNRSQVNNSNYPIKLSSNKLIF